MRGYSFVAWLGLIGVLLLPSLAHAQAISLDLGEDISGSTTARMVQLIALITVLSLAPSLLVMVTSFTRIIIVLSMVRTALGLQQSPPNQVMISLALFLTFFIMAPTFQKAWDNGIAPLVEEQITEQEAYDRTTLPFKQFMLRHVRDKDLQLFIGMSGVKAPANPELIGLHILTPAFMISELRRAFEIGFLLFLPFLIIDMFVASTLMSMGMMMLPPVLISLPFKIIFFVIIDGWYLLSESLVKSFGEGL
jgi:flagellar biosynthetic protein FliP